MAGNTKKIALVGAGQIGSILALLVATKNLGDVMLIDTAAGLAQGKALDLQQMLTVEGTAGKVRGSTNYADLRDADVVIVTAGIPRKPGMHRADLVAINADIIWRIGTAIQQYAPRAFVINVTNPLDCMVSILQKTSGLPPHKVVGMAGVLDTARMQLLLAEEFGVDPSSVTAMVIGSHSDEMVPLPHQALINGTPLPELIAAGKISQSRVDSLMDQVHHGGAEIVTLLKTGSAFFAPAAAAISIAEAYLHDTKRIMPCAAYLTGQYGIFGMYVGTPVQIGGQGVERIIELELDAKEQARFSKSIASIAELLEIAASYLRPAQAE